MSPECVAPSLSNQLNGKSPECVAHLLSTQLTRNSPECAVPLLSNQLVGMLFLRKVCYRCNGGQSHDCVFSRAFRITKLAVLSINSVPIPRRMLPLNVQFYC